MKSKSLKAVTIFTLIGVFFAAPALAILGVGDVVFDPQNYAQAIKTFIQLEQHYAQLIQIYQKACQQQEQLVWMSRSLPASVLSHYRAIANPWTTPSATNTYGNTGGWMGAITSGLNAEEGYLQATQKLSTYGPALGNIPTGQLDRVKTSYASVELTDEANLAGIDAIGRIRANAPAVERALQSLEDDTLSADPTMHTEVSELNKINATNVVALRNARDANLLLASIAESQIVAAKRSRDADSQAINQHTRFMSDGKAILDSQARDASQAMLNWRMP